MNSDRRLLNIEDAAEYLGGISISAIRSLMSRDLLIPVRIPSTRNPKEHSRRLLFDRADLDRLIDTWKAQSPTSAVPNENLSKAALLRWATR